MRYLTRVAWLLFLAAMPFLLYGFGLSLWRIVATHSWRDTHVTAFGAGTVLFIVIYHLTRRLLHRPWHYLATLEHEFTHALIGLLFLKIPVSLRATAYEGGAVVFRNGANVWIRLAPYYFPTLSLLVLLVNYLFFQNTAAAFYVALGVTVAFHLLTTWQETSFRQPDLQESGWLSSLLILPVMNLLFYGAIVSFVAGGMKGLGLFRGQGWQYTWAALHSVWAALI